jgi:hypothetical protein
MSKFGEELLESVKQMAAIERGEIGPAREIVYDRRSKKARVNIYFDEDIVGHFIVANAKRNHNDAPQPRGDTERERRE